MKKRNLLIIIYLRFTFSFVYFLSAIFQKKERDKKSGGTPPRLLSFRAPPPNHKK